MKRGIARILFKEARKVGVIVIAQFISNSRNVEVGILQQPLCFQDNFLMDPIAGGKSGDLFYSLIKIERRDVEKVGILLHLLVFSKLLLDELLELCGYHVFRTFKINALFVGKDPFAWMINIK